MLAVFHNVGWLCQGASRKDSRARHTGRGKNKDERSARERKEIRRLSRFEPGAPLDEVVRSVGAAAGKALHDPRRDNAFKSSIVGSVR
jgi:hypothetical protein